jgi:flagellar biosynthesis/type III secretory pathway M-ring protein FliF/YscJ
MVFNATFTNKKTSTEEEFEDTKRVIRIRTSKKNRQHNGQKKQYKGTNNDVMYEYTDSLGNDIYNLSRI